MRSCVTSARAHTVKPLRSVACASMSPPSKSSLLLMSTVFILNSAEAVTAADVAVLQGPARVVDGDTLYIDGNKIRLYGVDAPEKTQLCKDASGKDYNCGQVSLQALTDKLQNKTVSCKVRNTDQYGRNVASCDVQQPGSSEDVGNWLVSNGYAVAYRQYSKDYIAVEDTAHSQNRGVWQGSFQMPSEWRKAQKAGTAAPASIAPVAAPPVKCNAAPIKGNINKDGDKIYHVPGGRYYDSVQIDAADGERFFCTEAEAQAAGWRKSKA